MAVRRGELEPFDLHSGDWDTYSERMDQFFLCNQIDDDGLKRADFITMIGPECYSLLKTLCSPDIPSSKTLVELKELLAGYFQPTRIEIAERFKFYQRKQRDESVAEFLAALRKLAEHCGFGAYLETALRDAFVLGLRSDSIQKNLLKERTLNLKTALEYASGAEAVDRDMHKLKLGANETVSTHKVRANDNDDQGNSYRKGGHKGGSGGSPHADAPCHRCGNPAHRGPDCPYIEYRCRGCDRIGHLKRMCRDGEPFPTSGGGARRDFGASGGSGQSTHSVVPDMSMHNIRVPEYDDMYDIF